MAKLARGSEGNESLSSKSLKRKEPESQKKEAKSANKTPSKSVFSASYIKESLIDLNQTVQRISTNHEPSTQTESSELQALVHALESKVPDFQEKINALRAFFKEKEDKQVVQGDDIVDYLSAKQQMLLAYCTNLLFYLTMRVEGRSVKDHPVMQQLLRLRFALEKMRAIDGKIAHQIERLVQQARGFTPNPTISNTNDGEDEFKQQNAFSLTSSNSRPNPLALLGKDSGSEDQGEDSEEEDSDDDSGAKHKKHSKNKKTADYGEDSDDDRGHARKITGKNDKGVYRPPRMEAVPYIDAESKAEKEAERLKRKKQKLRSSEIFETLREEFSTAPEVSASSGISGVSNEGKKLLAEAKERQNFEEDRFVRLTMSRKDKKDMARRQREADRLDNKFGNFGGMEDFDDIVNSLEPDLSKKRKSRSGDDDDEGYEGKSSASKRSTIGNSKSMQKLGKAVNSSAAMERAAATFSKFDKASTDEGKASKLFKAK
jgi:hypothetical protein